MEFAVGHKICQPEPKLLVFEEEPAVVARGAPVLKFKENKKEDFQGCANRNISYCCFTR